MKLIIYGLGSGAQKVKKYLKREHLIVGYSDSFFKGESFGNEKFYEPEELIYADYDYVIIAIGNKDIYEKIYHNLINLGIKNIIRFYKIYSHKFSEINRIKTVENIMYKNKKMEGLVLGISHAEIGINPEYLSKSFYNLAISYQDLFYNLKQLEYLVDNYREKTKDLKYVILDMYDYTYFNYDISRSRGAIEYYRCSGFRDDDGHNYRYNTNFNSSINEEISKLWKEEKDEEWNDFLTIFDVELIKEDRSNVINYFIGDYPDRRLISKSINDSEIEQYKSQDGSLRNIQKNVYAHTENENIQILKKILNKLLEVNSDMKIYLILIPQYVEVEKKLKVIYNYWKIRFYNILSDFRKEYSFQILDFKDVEEIRSQKEYYIDLRHLNYKGAIAFTSLLDSYIKYD